MMITHISMSWFNTFEPKQQTESTERRKTSFRKEIVENVDLHKPCKNDA